MAHAQETRMRAYALFLEGQNFEQIGRAMGISPVTVSKWAEKPDENGQTWRDHRQRVLQQAAKSIEKRHKTKLLEHQKRAELLYDGLFERLLEDAPPVKSYEGAIYAFKSLSEFILKAEGDKEKPAALLVVQTLIDVLCEIPSIDKAIQKNWVTIREKIRERLSLE